MKFKATSIKLFLSISLIILQGFSLNAQQRNGKGDKTKAFLNFTFEVFEEEATISEPMQIALLKNVSSTQKGFLPIFLIKILRVIFVLAKIFTVKRSQLLHLLNDYQKPIKIYLIKT